MAIHNPFDHDYFLIEGAVKTSGGSLNLTKGQLALVDTRKPTADGLQVLSTVAGKSKDAKDLEFRLGVEKKGVSRSHSNKDQSTLPFALNEVVNLAVSAPKVTEQAFDEVILGYNGIDDSTAFDFRSGDPFFRVTLELTGAAIEFRGAKGGKELVSVNVEIPSCNILDTCAGCDDCNTEIDCKEIVEEAILRLRRKQLAGGQSVENFVDITPVFSCDTPAGLTEIPYDYYSLSLCDAGSEGAKALVAQAYDTEVIRTDRTGSTSTYQLLLPRAAGAPSDFTQTIASLIKGCDTCPAGYTANGISGVMYAISIEDNGTTQVTAVQGLPGAVAGTAVREAGTIAGMGFYTVVLDDELTAAEIAFFISTSAESATFEVVGKVAELCDNATVTTTSWTNTGTCNAIEETYQLTLPDDTCGNDRLVELNGAYASTVTLADSGTESQSVVTLTGTSGTANIDIEGVNYLVTFNTDLATTALDFDIAHSAALALLGISIEVNGADIIVQGANAVLLQKPSVANVSGDVAGTATVIAAAPLKGGCQTGYEIKVVSNLVCEECDDIFKDFYITDAPEAYNGTSWEKVEVSTSGSGNCLCGIRVKGKKFELKPEEALRDMIGFEETSTRVRISGDYPTEVREGIGRIPVGTAATTQISEAVDRTHLAGNLRDIENENRAYFRGYDYKSYLSRTLRGETSNMEDSSEQYVHYTLTVAPSKLSQGFGRRISENIDYGFYVQVGRQDALENLLNSVATSAGVKPVKAFN